MQKLFRLFTLFAVIVLSLSLAPSLTAETMGTNPKPHITVGQPSFLETFKLIAFAYFGL